MIAAGPAAPKTLLVSLAGWLAVTLGAVMGAAIAAQWLVISMMPLDLADVAAELARRPMHPWFRGWLVHIDLTQALIAMVAAALVVSGVGVLRRHHWGRWLFIALMGVAIGTQVGLVVLQHAVIESIAADLAARRDAAPAVESSLAALFTASRVLLGMVALAVSAGAAWLGWRFAAADVRAEFDRHGGLR